MQRVRSGLWSNDGHARERQRRNRLVHLPANVTTQIQRGKMEGTVSLTTQLFFDFLSPASPLDGRKSVLVALHANAFDACGGAISIVTAPPSRGAGGLSQLTREFQGYCGAFAVNARQQLTQSLSALQYTFKHTMRRELVGHIKRLSIQTHSTSLSEGKLRRPFSFGRFHLTGPRPTLPPFGWRNYY